MLIILSWTYNFLEFSLRWKQLESSYLLLKSRVSFPNKFPILILLKNLQMFSPFHNGLSKKNLCIYKMQSNVINIAEIENTHIRHSQQLSFNSIYVLISPNKIFTLKLRNSEIIHYIDHIFSVYNTQQSYFFSL